MANAEPASSSIRSEHAAAWDGVELVATHQDIEGGVEWSRDDDRHAVIIHLGGKMTELETELNGRGTSFEPATPAEIWIVPAGARYASRADGGEMRRALENSSWSPLSPSCIQTGRLTVSRAE